LWRRANFTDRLLLVYFTVLAAAIAIRSHRVPEWPSFLALHAVLIALIVALVWQSRRWPLAHAWYPLLIPLVTFMETAALHDLFVDEWRDRYILALEAAVFPEPPTVWLGRFSSVVFSELLQIGYLSYFVLLPIVAGLLYRRSDQRPFFRVMAAVMLAYVICYVVFLIFPTEGPAHTLRHLHTQPLPPGPFRAVVLFVQRAGTHGNAFPSAHVAGAVVPVIVASRYAPKLAPWLLVLLLLMCVGAVYDRYHYASDTLAGLIIGAVAAGVAASGAASPGAKR
jgi:membrane-associated phospholipid phosphatase